MNIFGWFRSVSDKFRTEATKVTHRAVAHQHSDSPVADVDTSFLSSVADQTNRDKSFVRMFWITGLMVALVALIAWKTFDLLLLIVLAYLFSVGLEGPVRFLEKGLKSRGLALFLVYFFLILFCLSLLLIIPFVAKQMFQMIQSIVISVNGISQQITTSGFDVFVQTTPYIPSWLKDNVLHMAQDESFVHSIKDMLASFSDIINSYVSSGLATDGFAWMRQFFGSSVITGWQISLVLILSVFFSLEYKSVFVFLVKFASPKARPVIYEKMLTIYDKMQLRLKGQLFLMIYIFSITLVGLWILRLLGFDIPQIGILALIAGMTEFLPYIGPILGGLPAVLVAFSAGGWGAALAVFVLFAVIQWTENNIVVPVVMNKVLGIRSLIIFIVMLLAASLFGFVGIVMAAPLSVIVVTLWGEQRIHPQITKTTSPDHDAG